MSECFHPVLNEDVSQEDVTRALVAQYRSETPNKNDAEPKNNDDDMDDEDMDDVKERLAKEPERADSLKNLMQNSHVKKEKFLLDEINDLKRRMVYVTHQITMLLNAFHVPSCECDNCKPIFQNQEVFRLLSGAESSSKKHDGSSVESNNTDVNQEPPVSEVPPLSVPSMNASSFANTDPANHCEALLSQFFNPSGLNSLNGAKLPEGLPMALDLTASGTSPKPFSGNTSHQNVNPGGRKSKYCSDEEKKMVAEYARRHGPSAAARKFNIPAPVAAYYHRKEYKQNKIPGAVLSNAAPSTRNAPSPSVGDDSENINGEWQNDIGACDLNKQAEQQTKSNPAHSTGSPGFLRGRGRGRPKLIGDELDAALVDYMVQVKQADPRGHLTASQALAIAREYIMSKAPGLLEEHGGTIKLKLTWAMKLVSRISEREKELELGLPAGTLSNMTRTMSSGTVNMPDSNLMADLAQNLLTQQMNQIMSQAMIGAGSASATPQILNVRELKLPKHDNDDGKGEVTDESSDRNEEDADTSEQQLDNDIENSIADSEMRSSETKAGGLQQHIISTDAF